MKLKTNDTVKVITGKDKGKTGKIMRTITSAKKIVVEKVNIRTKFIKKGESRPGERIQFEAPLDVSNVMIICPECKKTTRIGYKKLENGKKERICKKCSEAVDKATPAKK